MSDNSENNSVSTNQTVDADKGEVVTLEATLERLKAVELQFQEAVSTRDKAKEKLRKLEQDSGNVMEVQRKYDELFAEKSTLIEKLTSVQTEFDGFKGNIQAEKVSSVLQTAIEAAGAKSVSTVLKLIDKSKVELDEHGNIKTESVNTLLKELAESDPILFGETFIDPGVKRAGESSAESIFDKEIKACKTQKEIENVLRKYGKL